MSLKTPVLGVDISVVSLPSVYLLKNDKNVLDAKNSNFHFCVFKVLQCTIEAVVHHRYSSVFNTFLKIVK